MQFRRCLRGASNTGGVQLRRVTNIVNDGIICACKTVMMVATYSCGFDWSNIKCDIPYVEYYIAISIEFNFILKLVSEIIIGRTAQSDGL